MSSFNPSQLQGQQVYNIKSSAPQPNLSYNVMKFQSQKFSLDSLVPPVHMVRDLPKARRPHDAAEDASAETEEGANGKEKEKMDPTKVAPFGNAVKNRQNLFKKKTRSYVFAREPDADDSAPRKPRRDPDRFPWILSDFDSTTQYTGNVEAIAESTYMMLAVKDDTLELIPVSKWYKFMHKPKYRTLTLEEADEMLKLQGKRRLDTWVMHKKEKEESVEEKLNSSPTSVGGTSAPVKEEKSRLKKLLAGDDEPLRRQPRASRPRDDDAAELDFEEQKSDDEDLLFGIEDEEEAKEAIKRQYGKHGKRSGFIDDDDDDDEEDDDMGESGKGIAAAGKDLRKALKKADQVDDVYHSDEANPYLSEDDESEDEEQKVEDVKKEPSAEDTPINSSSTAAAIGASKLKRRKDGDPLSGPGKKLKREGSASPMTSPEHSTMMGKRKATMTKSPLHPGTATGGPARNLGSPALPAGSTSPPYSSSPNTAGRSAMGTKRKGAASSDDEKLEKKARTDFTPVTSSSASEILKQLSGSSSPPHPSSSSRPPSVRSKAPMGRPKTTSVRNTPQSESVNAGKRASSTSPLAAGTANRGTPRTSSNAEGGPRGTPKSTSNVEGTPKGTPRSSAAVGGAPRGTPKTSAAAEGAPRGTPRGSPLVEGSASGTPSSAATAAGKKKASSKKTGASPGSTPNSSSAASGGASKGRPAEAADIIDVFRREKKDAMQLGDLVRGLSHIMGKLTKEQQRNVVRGLIKNVCTVSKLDGGEKSGVVLSVKPEFKDW